MPCDFYYHPTHSTNTRLPHTVHIRILWSKNSVLIQRKIFLLQSCFYLYSLVQVVTLRGMLEKISRSFLDPIVAFAA